MPLDVPGCTRATMIIAVSISFVLINHIACSSPFILRTHCVALNVRISERDKAYFESFSG